jgi:hypothetical protein
MAGKDEWHASTKRFSEAEVATSISHRCTHGPSISLVSNDNNNLVHSNADDNLQDFLGKEYESILSPSPAHGAISSGTPAASIDLPELPSETWHLLDVYFSYTHSWLPIIEKHDLLRTSYQYSQNRGTTSSAVSGENAVLWAAIAYAKFQHRAINNIPRALGNVGEMVWTAERMYAHARALIPNEEGNLELGKQFPCSLQLRLELFRISRSIKRSLMFELFLRSGRMSHSILVILID